MSAAPSHSGHKADPERPPVGRRRAAHSVGDESFHLNASRDYFKTNSLERVDLSPVQFGELIQSDLKHWSAIINAVGARIE